MTTNAFLSPKSLVAVVLLGIFPVTTQAACQCLCVNGEEYEWVEICR